MYGGISVIRDNFGVCFSIKIYVGIHWNKFSFSYHQILCPDKNFIGLPVPCIELCLFHMVPKLFFSVFRVV